MNAQMELIAKNSPESFFKRGQKGQIQRKQSWKDKKDEDCPKCHKRLLNLQRSSASVTKPSSVPPIVHEVLNSQGQPLDSETRAFMEPRLGHDFSKVRVHADSKAAESAKAVNALAYTVGQDIIFGTGQYKPSTKMGSELLAHELTHVVQQSTSVEGMQARLDTSNPGDPAEHEARMVARAVMHGGIVTVPLSQKIQLARATPTSSSTSPATPTSSTSPASVPPVGCRIDVRATHISGILSPLPIWHLFIVYTDNAGQEYYFRGGPGGRCPTVNSGSFGTIKSTSGLYVPGTIDWDPSAPSITVASGPGACGKDACFASELSRIDALCIPYESTGPNSNTVAKTLLSKCGITPQKPVAVAPGWGDPVL